MKKIIALAIGAVLIAAPVSAQTRYVRPFADFALGFAEKYAPVQVSIDSNDWDSAADHLSDMTIWLLEADPEPCYAGLWGIASAFSAASTQVAIANAYGTDAFMILEMGSFLEELSALQEQITSGPTLDC